MIEEGVGVCVSYNTGSELADEFRRLRAPTQGVQVAIPRIGEAGGLLRLSTLRETLAGFVRERGVEVVFSPMEQIWQPFVAPVLDSVPVCYLAGVHDPRRRVGISVVSATNIVLRQEVRSASGVITFSTEMRQAFLKANRWIDPNVVFETVHPAFGSVEVGPRVLGRKHTLLFFGYLKEYKGIEQLLEAWPGIRAVFPDSNLVIAGDGPLRWLASTQRPGVSWDTRFVPEKEVARLLSEATAVVLPYQDATQSGVLALAMARGVPVVATPVGALPEQIRSTGSGVLASGVSPEAIGMAVLELLCDPVRYEECSRRALAAASTTHSWTRVARDVMDAADAVVAAAEGSKR